MNSTIAFAQAEDSLQALFRTARKFPLLEQEEEQELARRWRDGEDQMAARRLLGSHLRLVIKIALQYRGYGLSIADLVAEGNLGLMQALAKFDPDRGVRFSTYALWWIRAAMQDYILRSRSLVRMGTNASQKKLFFNLRRLKNRLGVVDEGDMPPETVAKIAKELEVSADDVIEANRRIGAVDSSLNSSLASDSETEWQDLLVDEAESQEDTTVAANLFRHRKRLVGDAMSVLTPRERHILVSRRLAENPITLNDLAEQYGISRERVRQIEVAAFDKLQRAVTAAELSQQAEPRRLC